VQHHHLASSATQLGGLWPVDASSSLADLPLSLSCSERTIDLVFRILSSLEGLFVTEEAIDKELGEELLHTALLFGRAILTLFID
jgi:hypothetical protein